MQCHIHILLQNYLKRHFDGKNYFAVENTQVIAEGKFVNHCVFHKTIPELPRLTQLLH